ncbi:hypothetical protein STRDD11_00914 [Streptococcus sp. DD11]|uniref:DUF805 domain-containing protein n=1 Tax=Streptococcus sp. DD11 TaxID=1777879 RepID=UPI0007979CDE|nr:hypothetical protein STRDD11_00914 [Streptococcus sp. DD11]
MFDAYKKFWKGYVDFTGRSTRSDYWFAVLANVLLFILFYAVLGILAVIDVSANQGASNFGIITSLILLTAVTVYIIAALLPSLAIRIRRLRDGGYHWACMFLILIPGIGSIILLVLMCQPSKYEYAQTYNNQGYSDYQNAQNQQSVQNPYQNQSSDQSPFQD